MAIPKPDPGDWIKANAQELKATDREVLAMLRDAYKAVNAELADLIARDSPLVSAAHRRSQLEQSRARLLSRQADIFQKLGDIVSARRLRSAVRAQRLSAAANASLLEAAGRADIAQYLYEGAKFASDRAIDVALARMRLSTVPLSQRIYRTQVWMDGRLGKLINATLASGINAKDFAKKARDWFNPNTPGGVRYASMRLARTEINNAFHAMTAEKAQSTPWIPNCAWHLSGSHPKKDICNVIASRNNGFGEGVYKSEDVPVRPHPQCMCYITPEPIDEDAFIDNFLAGDYDDYLDREIANAPTVDIGGSSPPPRPSVHDESLDEPVSRRTPSGKTAPVENASAYVEHSGGAGNATQRVQNLLSEGKTRAEIVESERKRGRPAGEADTAIDFVLVKNQVPNHVFPRKSDGTTGIQPKRDAKTVRVAPARSVGNRPAEPKISTPLGSKSTDLLNAEKRIDVTFTQPMKDRIKRVLAIQETHVGKQIDRIKKIQNGHDDKAKTAYGTFDPKTGKISFDRELHRHEADCMRSRRSGEKAHAGHDAIEGTIAHESGHAFMVTSDLDAEGRAKLAQGLTEALGLPTAPNLEGNRLPLLFFINWGKDEANKAIIRQKVSHYAASNPNELIAEIWADYTMNPNASREVRAAGLLLEGIMKGLPKR